MGASIDFHARIWYYRIQHDLFQKSDEELTYRPIEPHDCDLKCLAHNVYDEVPRPSKGKEDRFPKYSATKVLTRLQAFDTAYLGEQAIF